MATLACKKSIYAFVGSVIVSLSVLVSHASAQGDADEVAIVTSSSSTSTVAGVAESDPQPWYQVEQLSGQVEVGDFVVGPGRAELVVLPGQRVQTEISLANRISNNRQFTLTVEDVRGTSDGSRSVELLGEERGPYSIRDYVQFPESTLTLDLGERARIPVTISVPPDAEPGGYYGSILVSTVQEDVGNTSATTRSPIVARVGTLFFVTVPGDVVRQGQTKSFTTTNGKWWYEEGPIDLAITYENSGSVHVNPYGELRVSNFIGEEVGFVELEPWFVLPKSLRTRDITWDRELLFGRYTATVHINRGYDDIVDEQSVVFWVLPWKVVASLFVVLFVIFFTARLFFRTFEFKRRS